MLDFLGDDDALSLITSLDNEKTVATNWPVRGDSIHPVGCAVENSDIGGRLGISACSSVTL